jgi:hypothetical protein
MTVAWSTVPSTDLYSVELADSRDGEAFQTTTCTRASRSLLIVDLLPATAYVFRLRSHPASAPSIVWGWRNATANATVRCETRPTPMGSASRLRRTGDLEATAIELNWDAPASSAAAMVRVARLGDVVVELGATVRAHDHRWARAIRIPRGVRTARIDGLQAGSTYAIAVRVEGATVSDSVVMRTAQHAGRSNTSVMYTTMYRVSEYTYDIDYLRNHDSADLAGSAGFLTSTNDNLFFQLALAPVTQYCVQHVAVSPSAAAGRIAGFAPYTSCNGPEAAPRTHPRDPLCICDVFPDRLIAQQSADQMAAECGAVTWNTTDSTHDSPPCVCANDTAGANASKWAVPAAARRFVGAMPVYAPYFYYQYPLSEYPRSTLFGRNYATPKPGACAEGEPIGGGATGCTWRRAPTARIVWGSELLRRGWNNTAVDHWPLHRYGPNQSAQLAHNLPIFAGAFDALQGRLTPRCCGC